ncbi:uncharacterized protein LOC113377759 isoform X2 [Ctenocephalides felis]|uniref:uncharacterized protein LOC113377759 isoform X2 n=1 Tax=Ctenocephalides felis TaxID=7515 RepID=UPI000E6E21ED|nr:uncharacterized protein LOC113377759 isoform X2 [Ctenocephalides felis]
MNEASYGWCIQIISSAIISTMIAGRIKTISIIAISIVTSVLFYPVIIHITCGEIGFLRSSSMFSENVSFKDYGGGTIIHVTGGLFALVSCLILGPRVMRLKSIDVYGLTDDAPTISMLGYVLIVVGLFAMCMPSPTYEQDRVPGNYTGFAAICFIMAFTGGFLTMICLQTAFRGGLYTYWTFLACLQGGISGIVTISTAPEIHNAVMSLFVGAFGSLICYLFERIIYRSNLEDYCNLVAVHLCSGVVGSLLCVLTAAGDDLVIIAALLILGLSLCKALRNNDEVRNNNRAKHIQEIMNSYYKLEPFSRLFPLSNELQLLKEQRINTRWVYVKSKVPEYQTRIGWSKSDFFWYANKTAAATLVYNAQTVPKLISDMPEINYDKLVQDTQKNSLTFEKAYMINEYATNLPRKLYLPKSLTKWPILKLSHKYLITKSSEQYKIRPTRHRLVPLRVFNKPLKVTHKKVVIRNQRQLRNSYKNLLLSDINTYCHKSNIDMRNNKTKCITHNNSNE